MTRFKCFLPKEKGTCGEMKKCDGWKKRRVCSVKVLVG